jgi:hypothetical protein
MLPRGDRVPPGATPGLESQNGARQWLAVGGRAKVGRVEYVCAVCDERIEPDDSGKVRLDGVTHQSAPKAWVPGAGDRARGLPPAAPDTL